MLSKKLKRTLFSVAILLASVFVGHGAFSLSSQDTDINDCINGENVGWVSCPVIDSIRNSVEGLYSWLIENWLAINPKLLSFASSSDAGASVHDAWQYFQGIANILLIVYLLVVIISQVTGFGISNYGVKKALPRIAVAVILVNLSYYICQAVVDLANILGNGIFGLLDGLITSSGIIADGQNDTGYSVALLAILILVVTAVVKITAMSPTLINFAMMGLIGVLVAVIFLFIVLGLRQVLTVLLVTVSPIAILCSTVPGLRGVYKKWLNLFKGVLITYPVCSLLIGGGALASQVLYDAWGGDSNFFAAVACMIICIVPFFFIPSITFKSIGALGAIVDKVRYGKNGRGGIAGLAKGMYKGSDMNRRLNRANEKKKNYRRAGIKTDIRGNAKRDPNTGEVIRKTRRNGTYKGDAHYMDAAMRQLDAENRAARYLSDPDMIKNREDQDMVKEYERSLTGRSIDELTGANDPSKGYRGAVADLQKALSGKDDMEKRKARAKVAAYGKLLAGSRSGRKFLASELTSYDSSPIANQLDVVESAFSGIDSQGMNDLMRSSPRLGSYANSIRTNGYAATGQYSSYGYTSDMLSGLTQDDFAALDGDDKREIFSQAALAGHMFGNDGSLLGGFRVKDDEFATNLSRLTNTATSSVDTMAKMAPEEQQWVNAFNAQRQKQVQDMSAGLQSGSITEAMLKSQYMTAARGSQGMKMEAIEMELRRRGIPNMDAEIENLRRAAEATNNAAAKASAANSRILNS